MRTTFASTSAASATREPWRRQPLRPRRRLRRKASASESRERRATSATSTPEASAFRVRLVRTSWTAVRTSSPLVIRVRPPRWSCSTGTAPAPSAHHRHQQAGHASERASSMGDRRPRHARRDGSRTGRSRASVGGQEPHTWAASSASTSLATAHSPAQSPPSTRGSRSGTCATRTATRRTSAPPRSAPCLVPQGNLAPMPLPLQLLHSVCHEAARDDDLNASGLQHSFYTK